MADLDEDGALLQTPTPPVPRLVWTALSPAWPTDLVLQSDALHIPKPAQTRPSNAEAVRREAIEAKDFARGSWQELTADVRREQAQFVERANRNAATIAQHYQTTSATLVAAHQADLDALAASGERARAGVEAAADLAQDRLDTADRNTQAAVSVAGTRAYGLIASGERRGTSRIAGVVKDLVRENVAVFDQAIFDTGMATDTAMLALFVWRLQRATNYPAEISTPAESAAVNESLQARVPRWSETEGLRLDRQQEKLTTSWRSTQKQTDCSLSCSFKAAIEEANTSMAREGRKRVSAALVDARRTLKVQVREGRSTLVSLRRTCLAQIEAQQRAARKRMQEQVRVALQAARAEAQSAMSGVLSSARASLASYPRAVRGYEQTLRRAAGKGAKTLRSTTGRGREGALLATQRASAQLDQKLQDNRDRATAALDRRLVEQSLARAQHLASFESAAFDPQVTGRLAEALEGMELAFSRIAGTVLQAAASWALPLEERMATFIEARREDARKQLQQIRTGVPAKAPPDAAKGGKGSGKSAGGKSAAEASQPAADCHHCEEDKGKAGNTGTQAGASSGKPTGLDKQVADETTLIKRRNTPEKFFEKQISGTIGQVKDNLYTRAKDISGRFKGGFWGTVDEEGAIATLRGLTFLKGRALNEYFYPINYHGYLVDHLYHYLDDDPEDLRACLAYLRGDAVEGARLELKNSTHWYNDDEARIEATLRALSPEQLKQLGKDHKDVVDDVRDCLGGTDLKVFDALSGGHYATASALRLKDAVDEARYNDDADAVHTKIGIHTAPEANDWLNSDAAFARVSASEALAEKDNYRLEVVGELGKLVSDADVAKGLKPGQELPKLSAEERAVAYVTREVAVYDAYGGGPEGGGTAIPTRMEGANRDLAEALLLHGEGSTEARAARLGVEMQRKGDAPDPINLAKATHDERFINGEPKTEEEREGQKAAARQRADVLLLAAQRYAGAPATTPDKSDTSKPDPGNADPDKPAADATADPKKEDPLAPLKDKQVQDSRERLVKAMRDRFGSDSVGADLAAGLISDTRVSPETAALAMRHGMYARLGTNEQLLFDVVGRMDRDEVRQMREAFKRQTGGKNLDAELGVYGEGGTFTELSGDDALKMERLMLGVARNDRERLEVAAFALQQQRREAGGLGTSLAEGSLAERGMISTERRLELLAGGPIALSRRGELLSKLPNFDADHKYKGADRHEFLATVKSAEGIAENYAASIDSFADIATTAIAVLGAVAAAVIIVATGGAAAPLIAAAVATGLASMAANYAIKGGRYGWEQAAIDLGMTAVQAVTAGVGAQLGAAAQVASKGAQAATQASRTLAMLSKIFTGNPITDQIIIGAITGSISGLGSAALSEQTWDSKNPAGALFNGLLRGAAGGATTAALTNSVEALAGKGAALAGKARELMQQGGGGLLARTGAGFNNALRASTGGGALRSVGAMLARGGARAVTSGLGGMAGRGAELLVDRSMGRYRGDLGDAFVEMGHTGLQAAVQGLGEGAAEARGQQIHDAHTKAAGESINAERARNGQAPLHGEHLNAAAEDLGFLNLHGRRGRSADAASANLGHVALHGGMAPTLAIRNPPPVVADSMRAELMRHVPPGRHAEFADVPIRVMPAAEYHQLTRSTSGSVVTLVQDGHPVVIIREGTPLGRLADEGPHLIQTRDAATRGRAARLDEATLAHWDHLDLDTQIDLYRTKLELEVDAHQQIIESLQRERPGDPAGKARIDAEIARNEQTLRNLRARQEEVTTIGPRERAAIERGDHALPQYLEQPARLFSKGEREVPPGGIFDSRGEEHVERLQRFDRGNTFNTEMEGRYRFNEVTLDAPGGGRPRIDSYEPGQQIVSRKYTQTADVGPEAIINHINELIEKYPHGARIADTKGNQALLREGRTRFGRSAGEHIQGQHVLLVPEQIHPIPRSVLDHAERAGVLIVDASGRIYSPAHLAHPHPDDGVPRLSSRDPDQHADAMREQLLKHVPEEHHEFAADVPIVVLPDKEFRRMSGGSERGSVFIQVREHGPLIVVRDGTPVTRLADEGPHLVQMRDPATSARVQRLDESTLARWNSLDIDHQIDLYRTKIQLEIDAHQRIADSLRNSPAPERWEMARNERTLGQLRARLDEVQALDMHQRAAIRSGREEPPQYLKEPARLFSKESKPAGGAGGEEGGATAASPARGRPAGMTDEEVRQARIDRKLRERQDKAARATDEHRELPVPTDEPQSQSKAGQKTEELPATSAEPSFARSVFARFPEGAILQCGSVPEQADFLAANVPGLSSLQAASILDSAFSRNSSAVFGGSRVRGDFNDLSDLDVGFGSLSERQAQREIRKINAEGFETPLETLTIVPGKTTATIEKIVSPEEFFQRSGIRAGGDPRAGQPYVPSGSITVTKDGLIVLNPPGKR